MREREKWGGDYFQNDDGEGVIPGCQLLGYRGRGCKYFVNTWIYPGSGIFQVIMMETEHVN